MSQVYKEKILRMQVPAKLFNKKRGRGERDEIIYLSLSFYSHQAIVRMKPLTTSHLHCKQSLSPGSKSPPPL